jgi:hypothetical protein
MGRDRREHDLSGERSGRIIELAFRFLGGYDVLGPTDETIFVEGAPKEQLFLNVLGDEEFDFGCDGLFCNLVLFCH